MLFHSFSFNFYSTYYFALTCLNKPNQICSNVETNLTSPPGATTWLATPKRCLRSSISSWSACGSWWSSSPVPLNTTRSSWSLFTSTSTPASLETSSATTSGRGESSGEVQASVRFPAFRASTIQFENVETNFFFFLSNLTRVESMKRLTRFGIICGRIVQSSSIPCTDQTTASLRDSSDHLPPPTVLSMSTPQSLPSSKKVSLVIEIKINLVWVSYFLPKCVSILV